MSFQTPKFCPICYRGAVPFTTTMLPDADARRCECAGCGIYTAENELLATLNQQSLTARERIAISGAIRRATDVGQRVHLRGGELAAIVRSQSLPDALTQWDNLISEIARRTRFGESTQPENAEAWATRLFFQLWTDVVALLQEIGNFVRMTAAPPGPSGGAVAFKLTMDGWREAHKIRERRGSGRQAFVAMWFHEGMRSAYGEAIAPALMGTGYDPYRVDFAHHDRRIDDEIMAQIRRSSLMVADLTGGRQSVYYEAGFAQGLGIPVIWSCNRSWMAKIINPTQLAPEMATAPECVSSNWFDCVAFDAKHLPFILWGDNDELRKKLSDRIQGLGLDVASRELG